MKEALVRRRRHLHRHPELSLQERETQDFVLSELAAMGVEGRRLGGTGVACRLGPAAGPALALRADMDALPVHEAGDKSYKVTTTMENLENDYSTASTSVVMDAIDLHPPILGSFVAHSLFDPVPTELQ